MARALTWLTKKMALETIVNLPQMYTQQKAPLNHIGKNVYALSNINVLNYI